MNFRKTGTTALLLALALSGCAAGNSATSDAPASAGSAPAEVVVIGESAWSDSADGSAAGADAGMATGFVVPESLPIGDYDWSAPHFTSMDKVAQADYDGGGPIAASVRKGEGVPLDELSSDLNEYAYDWTETLALPGELGEDGEAATVEVACHGYEEGIVNFAEWEANGCSYDVWVVGVEGENLGMTPAELAEVVAAIR